MEEDAPTVTGFLTFDSELLCSKDVLGSSTPITIGGHAGTLYFPLFPENWKQGAPLPTLSPPEIVRTWKRDGKAIHYGKVMNYPLCDSHVRRAVVRFPVHSDCPDTTSQEIYLDVGRWHSLFVQYVTILTKISLVRKVMESSAKYLELYHDEPNQKLRHIQMKENDIVINLSEDDDDYRLTQARLTTAAAFASDRIPLKLEYSLLSRAYDDLALENYRSAIVESAAGIEMALAQYLKSNWKGRSKTFEETLPVKSRTLGKLFEWLPKIDKAFSNENYKVEFVEPRNDVVHRGYYPNESEATTFVYKISKLLESLSPNIENSQSVP